MPVIDAIEPDGAWCPMAHSNGFDDSFHDLPPLRTVRHLQSIPQPAHGLISLGAFTGEAFAVCTFHGPDQPSLVAFDYRDGSILWTSPLEDFPVVRYGRQTSGILLAKVRQDGQPAVRRIFGANPFEFIAYDDAGRRVWKRLVTELLPAADQGIGIPRSFSCTADNALIIATSGGWVIKLAPDSGDLIDAWYMRSSAVTGGQLQHGHFFTTLSPVTIDNRFYLVVNFQADQAQASPERASPVYLVRLDLAGRTAEDGRNLIRPLTVPLAPTDRPPDRLEMAPAGEPRYYGSPVGMMLSNGNPLIIGSTSVLVGGQLFAEVLGMEDRNGTLAMRWRSRLDSHPGEVVAAAPGLYAAAGVYIVATKSAVHVFEQVDQLGGDVRPARTIRAFELLTVDIRLHAAEVTLTSPISVTFDREHDELVAYVNANVRRQPGEPAYGFLTAFTVPLSGGRPSRALWTEALLRTPQGEPAAFPGTCGQPSLFRYFDGTATATGLIVNTVSNGTVILR